MRLTADDGWIGPWPEICGTKLQTMLIDQVTNSGALPVLEKAMQFAARRQSLIAHNVANLSTPGFRPTDVSVGDFQTALGEAVDRRRAAGRTGDVRFESTREVKSDSRGRLHLDPHRPTGNILFHDRNNRDLERHMQDMVENLTAFRVSSDFFRSGLELVNLAIRERF